MCDLARRLGLKLHTLAGVTKESRSFESLMPPNYASFAVASDIYESLGRNIDK